MKKLIVALACAVLIVLGWSRPADAATGCILQVKGSVGIVVCGGLVVDRLNLPTVKVTETVTQQVIKRVTVPGPTIYVTRSPAPQQSTVTVTAKPRVITKTQTATSAPQPNRASVSSPSAKPSNPSPTNPGPTPSATPSKTPIETVTPGNSSPNTPAFDLGDGKTTGEEAAVGVLTLILLIMGAFAILYTGYILGYKESQSKDSSFIRGLLEQARLKQMGK